jgi:ubiquitin-conjugating enzyme E2 S
MASEEKPDSEIKLILDDENWTTVMADIIGPIDTPFEGGIFRCKLELSSEFPKQPPKGYFLTKIFHPNIANSGEICVNTLKKDWNPASWSFSNILNVIRCLLIEPFPESALNEEAGRLFMEEYQSYFSTARLYTTVHAVPKTSGGVGEASAA